MTIVSDTIEKFILSLMNKDEKDILEIQRNELAEYFNCAPSQINYVLATRFTPDKGYFIQSKRGGGGYIKIIRVNIKENKDIREILINSIGNSITKQKAYTIIDNLKEKGFITKRESLIMKNAIGDRALSIVNGYKNNLRATIIKDMLIALIG
ncbi:CtsR family transcriptional regulator [Clostridium sp. D2Q-11]|uniref:Transcriptional regulator CtsR n=1 Tax=Anaeromonas frigoriresistens TaxID=2683708 RepID=A0A942UU50_9FIRM|nr:CtsR family transcriptional regulator [Anaeromonas frigoriresistens]MBS4536846.1 CtsR family transcriptional regulator [Anaeromonas frigoriresistens]